MTDTHKGDDAALIEELEGVVSDLETAEWVSAPACITTLKRVMAALAARGAGQGDPVGWVKFGFIRDGDGRDIGQDEPDVRWGAQEPSEADDPWLPLYASPPLGGWKPDREAERPCLTPESVYEWGLETERKLTVSVRFPFDIGFWGKGTHLINALDVDESDKTAWDAERLRRYDLQAAEKRRITDLIHDQMEVVAADAYKALRDLDLRMGQDTVEYGVQHARWRRTKRGERPVPAPPIAAAPEGGEA